MEGNPETRSERPRATLRRVAAELGVSPMTVSNAYSRPDQLSAALRERIFETAERLGYAGPDPVARSLRRQRTNVAGVLYSNPLSYAFDDAAAVLFLRGVTASTEASGMGLLLVPGSMGSPAERGAAAGAAAVDGFVVYSMADDDPLVEAALRRGLPAVTVDQPLREGVPFVGIDDEAAAVAAAEHLAGLGHERYGVISFALAADGRAGIADASRQRSATYRVTRSRLEGYASVLSSAGLSWEDVTVYECPGSTAALGSIAARTLLDADPRPTAVLATSDQLALGALEACRELGLSVPDDVSVVGFDDVPLAATAAPALTTVEQDHARKGLLAGRLLVAQLRGEGAPSPDLIPARLVTRGSTGPAR